LRPEVTATPLNTGRAPTTSARRTWIGLFRGINVGGRNLLAARSLEALRAPSERFTVRGRVLYLEAPQGIGRSRLAARAERLPGVPATARNWRTVTRLLEMARRAD